MELVNPAAESRRKLMADARGFDLDLPAAPVLQNQRGGRIVFSVQIRALRDADHSTVSSDITLAARRIGFEAGSFGKYSKPGAGMPVGIGESDFVGDDFGGFQLPLFMDMQQNCGCEHGKAAEGEQSQLPKFFLQVEHLRLEIVLLRLGIHGGLHQRRALFSKTPVGVPVNTGIP